MMMAHRTWRDLLRLRGWLGNLGPNLHKVEVEEEERELMKWEEKRHMEKLSSSSTPGLFGEMMGDWKTGIVVQPLVVGGTGFCKDPSLLLAGSCFCPPLLEGQGSQGFLLSGCAGLLGLARCKT